MPENKEHQILAIILSGGAGKRFGGADKGLQLYQGQALIQFVIDAIKPQVAEIVICINRNASEYQKLGYATVFDRNKNHQGPIAGIMAAFDFAEQSNGESTFGYALISSCDSPALPAGYVKTLLEKLQENNAAVAVVNDGERNQNLHCLISFNAWDSLRGFYDGGGRAMHRWYQEVDVVAVNFSAQAECFLNINSLAQL